MWSHSIGSSDIAKRYGGVGFRIKIERIDRKSLFCLELSIV